MIDPKFKGMKLASSSAVAEPGLMRLFAKATGQTNPIYFDEAAAIEAGYPALVAAPTYTLCLSSGNRNDIKDMFLAMGVNPARVVHGEQSFELFGMLFAGDRVNFTSEILDIFSKRNGALEMIVQEVRGSKPDGQSVVRALSTIVVRNEG